MLALLMLLFVGVASSAAAAIPSANRCGKFSPTDEVSRSLTIAEVERQEMAQLSAWLKVRPDMPKVPFGFGNAEWLAFKSMIQPGDKIARYSTDRRSWQHLAGETGVALIRSVCVTRTFVTMMN